MITTEEPAQILAPAVPAQLIRETLNGRPLYYKGYRDVLAGRAKPQEIMGSSDLQSVLVGAIYGYLWGLIDRKRFRLVTSEVGLHIG